MRDACLEPPGSFTYCLAPVPVATYLDDQHKEDDNGEDDLSCIAALVIGSVVQLNPQGLQAVGHGDAATIVKGELDPCGTKDAQLRIVRHQLA
jgi:hypothetical protein